MLRGSAAIRTVEEASKDAGAMADTVSGDAGALEVPVEDLHAQQCAGVGDQEYGLEIL